MLFYSIFIILLNLNNVYDVDSNENKKVKILLLIINSNLSVHQLLNTNS